MTVVVGIDVGLTGAFCVLRGTTIIALEDLPTRAKKGTGLIKREIDGAQLAFRLRIALGEYVDEAIAVLENVRAMSKGGSPQGVSSVFAFGETKGVIRGVLEGMQLERIEYVEPIVWKRSYSITKDTNGSLAREKARAIFADQEAHLAMISRVKDHNRAEAMLIARFGWQRFA